MVDVKTMADGKYAADDLPDTEVVGIAEAVIVGGALVFGGRASDTSNLPDESGHWAFKGIALDQSECAVGTPGNPCSKAKLLEAIVDFAKLPEIAAADVSGGAMAAAGTLLPTAASKEASAVRKAAAALDCNSESCVVSNPKFVQFAENKGVAVRAEKERVFKVAGPRNTSALLSDSHIDETLRRWARSMPFLYTFDFAMMDFASTGHPLHEYNIVDVLAGKYPQKLGRGYAPVRRPATCVACVLNTDVHGGPGKHWVAVFVDTRTPEWTVEYFNSTGRPPVKAMVEWMEQTREDLETIAKGKTVKTVAVTSVSHQQQDTECGLYSLFFIRRRAEGVPYTFFTEKPIPDGVMTTFRKFVFRES